MAENQNGCSLEDCHTNLFALADLSGIKWRRLNAQSDTSYTADPLDDPVLVSYSKCVQADLLCVWRRQPKNANNSHHSSSSGPGLGGSNRSPMNGANSMACPKELWLFWYGDEPSSLQSFISSDLFEVESGSWESGPLSYECRTLLFKAFHNLIERCLLAQNFARVGKWFVQPYNNTDQLNKDSAHLSMSFNFFLHGDSTVCVSVDVRRHEALFSLTHTVLSAAQHITVVLLAPYGLSGTLTGKIYSDSEARSMQMMEDWKKYVMVFIMEMCVDECEGDEGSQFFYCKYETGVRLRYPSNFVLMTSDVNAAVLKRMSTVSSSSANTSNVSNNNVGANNFCNNLATGALQQQQQVDSKRSLLLQWNYSAKVIEKSWRDLVVANGQVAHGQSQGSEDHALYNATNNIVWNFGDVTQRSNCHCPKSRTQKPALSSSKLSQPPSTSLMSSAPSSLTSLNKSSLGGFGGGSLSSWKQQQQASNNNNNSNNNYNSKAEGRVRAHKACTPYHKRHANFTHKLLSSTSSSLLTSSSLSLTTSTASSTISLLSQATLSQQLMSSLEANSFTLPMNFGWKNASSSSSMPASLLTSTSTAFGGSNRGGIVNVHNGSVMPGVDQQNNNNSQILPAVTQLSSSSATSSATATNVNSMASKSLLHQITSGLDSSPHSAAPSPLMVTPNAQGSTVNQNGSDPTMPTLSPQPPTKSGGSVEVGGRSILNSGRSITTGKDGHIGSVADGAVSDGVHNGNNDSNNGINVAGNVNYKKTVGGSSSGGLGSTTASNGSALATSILYTCSVDDYKSKYESLADSSVKSELLSRVRPADVGKTWIKQQNRKRSRSISQQNIVGTVPKKPMLMCQFPGEDDEEMKIPSLIVQPNFKLPNQGFICSATNPSNVSDQSFWTVVGEASGREDSLHTQHRHSNFSLIPGGSNSPFSGYQDDRYNNNNRDSVLPKIKKEDNQGSDFFGGMDDSRNAMDYSSSPITLSSSKNDFAATTAPGHNLPLQQQQQQQQQTQQQHQLGLSSSFTRQSTNVMPMSSIATLMRENDLKPNIQDLDKMFDTDEEIEPDSPNRPESIRDESMATAFKSTSLSTNFTQGKFLFNLMTFATFLFVYCYCLTVKDLSRMFPTPPSADNPCSEPSPMMEIDSHHDYGQQQQHCQQQQQQHSQQQQLLHQQLLLQHSTSSASFSPLINSSMANVSQSLINLRKECSSLYKIPLISRIPMSADYNPIQLPNTLSIPLNASNLVYKSSAPQPAVSSSSSTSLQPPFSSLIPSSSSFAYRQQQQQHQQLQHQQQQQRMNIGGMTGVIGGKVVGAGFMINNGRTPLSYDMLSPASNSSINRRPAGSVDSRVASSLEPINSLMVNVMISDSVLNLFKDHNFDSCTLCACNRNIDGSDIGIYARTSSDALVPSVLSSIEGIYGLKSGLFYEDEVEISGYYHTGLDNIRKPPLIKRHSSNNNNNNMNNNNNNNNSNNTNNVNNNNSNVGNSEENALSDDGITADIISIIREQFSTQFPTMPIQNLFKSEYSRFISRSNCGSGSNSGSNCGSSSGGCGDGKNKSVVGGVSVEEPVDLEMKDCSDACFLALEYCKFLSMENNNNSSSNNNNNNVGGGCNSQLSSSSSLLVDRSKVCLHEWSFRHELAPLPSSSLEVVRLLKQLQPLLQDAIQKKRSTRLWESVYTISGPLTWKDFHLLAGRGSKETSEPKSIPYLMVGYDKELLNISPHSIKYWDKLMLEPLCEPRDVLYLVVSPENDVVIDQVSNFFNDFSIMYEQCRLGKHRVLYDKLRDGIIRVGRKNEEPLRDVVIDDWYNNIDNIIVKNLNEKRQVYRDAAKIHSASGGSRFTISNPDQPPFTLYSTSTSSSSSLPNVMNLPPVPQHSFSQTISNPLAGINSNPNNNNNNNNNNGPVDSSMSGVFGGEKMDFSMNAGSNNLNSMSNNDNDGTNSSHQLQDGSGGGGYGSDFLHNNNLSHEVVVAGQMPYVVVYIVDSFNYTSPSNNTNNGSNDDDDDGSFSARMVMMSLLRGFNNMVKMMPEKLQPYVKLQIVPQDMIMDSCQRQTTSYMKNLCFSVYTSCRRQLSHHNMEKSLTGFGPTSSANKIIKKLNSTYQQLQHQGVISNNGAGAGGAGTNGGPGSGSLLGNVSANSVVSFGNNNGLITSAGNVIIINSTIASTLLYSPPFILAPPLFQSTSILSPENYKEPLEKCGVLLCAYCLSEDQRFLLASLVDSTGELLETTCINIDIGDRKVRRRATVRRFAFHKLWEFILGTVACTARPWRLVVGRFGRLGHGELKGWSMILSKRNLQSSCLMLRRICQTCNIPSANQCPSILSACLVSTEIHPSIHIMVDAVKKEENQSSKRQLSTPKDASCTHILVYPTSATAQATDPNSASDTHMDFTATELLNEEELLNGFDPEDPDMINDFWTNLDNSPERIIDDENHDDPSSIQSRGTFLGGSNIEHEENNNLNLLQQPQAMGFYVSTAPPGPLPDWFWSSCPQRHDHCPVCLKASLHLHCPMVQQNQDDLIHQSSNHKKSTHPLDSYLTCDVLRYVLETYNALSWLTIDPSTNDRRTCLPVHMLILMQLYHAVKAYL
ncbi:hypothetical protein HELRODRAFT_180782 [Helobdella robusta]|uniref:Mediator of RNA polymerase II transcription subunit 13 n=1 Tax=Helobdella robusta TaxID=6412 RepID=T1FG99_HELRO|nr:hypothetical protein HELRODRAFT_180782 [Helobdella robusta]ESN93685.1 hypothetical protein HELRODRAFT_180782 [Helobdella robusta]